MKAMTRDELIAALDKHYANPDRRARLKKLIKRIATSLKGGHGEDGSR